MKFNSFVISSLLAFSAAVSAAKDNVAVEEKVIIDEKMPPIKPTIITIKPTIIPTIKPTLTIKPTILPTIKPCPLGKGLVREQRLQCSKLNGKFYSKFHPYPDCYTDYVCFVGKMESGQRLIKDCILIDKKFYCSAYISSIECCRPKSKSYNFNQCVKEASKIFSDFRYSKGLVVSEIKEHPVSESFISGQTYSYDDNTKFKYADKH